VPEHVWVRLEAQLCRDAQPRHHLAPTRAVLKGEPRSPAAARCGRRSIPD
jgi:hypothetical protein